VIYNCSNTGLRGKKFLFLLPHIPTPRHNPAARARPGPPHASQLRVPSGRHGWQRG
jgi:hypothetical protein